MGIGKAFGLHFDKLFNATMGEAKKQAAMYTDAEIYKYLVSIINGTNKSGDFLGIYEQRAAIRKQLHIPDDYVFTGNFGDKDTAYTIYKPNLLELKILSIKGDYGLIANDIFEYEYALKSGYTKNGKTWQDFLDAIK